MAFPRETNVTKEEIGDYEIIFTVSASGPDLGTMEVQIVLSSGEKFTRNYDLIARLQDDAPGQAHLANLISLRNYLNTRLINEVLPL
jgi:hypothetical protein